MTSKNNTKEIQPVSISEIQESRKNWDIFIKKLENYNKNRRENRKN